MYNNLLISLSQAPSLEFLRGKWGLKPPFLCENRESTRPINWGWNGCYMSSLKKKISNLLIPYSLFGLGWVAYSFCKHWITKKNYWILCMYGLHVDTRRPSDILIHNSPPTPLRQGRSLCLELDCLLSFGLCFLLKHWRYRNVSNPA